MGWIGDVWGSLDRWKIWRVNREIPDRVAALENRVAILEKKLERGPADVCKACGARSLRMKSSPFVGGGTREIWECGDCKVIEHRRFAAAPPPP